MIMHHHNVTKGASLFHLYTCIKSRPADALHCAGHGGQGSEAREKELNSLHADGERIRPHTAKVPPIPHGGIRRGEAFGYCQAHLDRRGEVRDVGWQGQQFCFFFVKVVIITKPQGRPNWKALEDKHRLNEYVGYLEHTVGMGVDGRCQKLDRIVIALEFLTITYDYDSSEYRKVQQVLAIIKGWKKTYGVKRRRVEEERKEIASEVKYTLSDVYDPLENPRVCSFYKRTVASSKKCSYIPIKTARTAMAIQFMTVLYRSVSRPGAVKNLTVAQYGRGRVRGETFVFASSRHKTAEMGAQRLTVSLEERANLDAYLKYIRPMLLGDTESDLFFVVEKGRPVRPSALIKALSKEFELELLSPTNARKVAGTQAIGSLAPEEGRALVEQMAHSARTHKRYYELSRGAVGAAKAHKALRKLHRSDSTPPSAKKQRVPFSPKLEALIRAQFENCIQQDQYPKVSDCDDFVEKFAIIETSAKDIYDKVRSIIRKNVGESGR